MSYVRRQVAHIPKYDARRFPWTNFWAAAASVEDMSS